MTPIAQAVAAATITVARVWIRKGRVRACVAGLIALEWADAMRPSVVPCDRNATGRALACFQQQAVVVGIAATLDFDKVAHELTRLLRIDQRQAPSRIRVQGGRTDRPCGCSQRVALGKAVATCVGQTGEIDGGVQLLRTQHMDRVAAQIIGGHEPIVSELALDG